MTTWGGLKVRMGMVDWIGWVFVWGKGVPFFLRSGLEL